MAVGTVTIDLEANTAKFNKQMQSFSKKLDKQIKGITNGLKKIGIVALAAGTGLAILTKSAINANDELAKLSGKLGISTEDLSALKFAADFSGASLGNLDGALSALTRRFNNFDKTGGGAAKSAFEELGIATRDTDGNLRNINDVFIEIAEKVSKMEAGIRKTAIVQDVFSKSQAKIIPLLNEGAAGLEAFRKQAESMGLILSGRTAKASEAFNDKLDVMGKMAAGVGARLAEKLLPTLNRLAERLINISSNADFDNFLDGIAVAVEAIIVAFQGLFLILKGASIVFDVLAGNEARANEKGKDFLKTLEDMQKALKNIGKADAAFNITKKTSGATLPAVASPNIDKDKDKIKSFSEQVATFYKTITDLNTQFANAFKNTMGGLEDAIIGFTQTGKFSFRDMAASIINDISRIAIKQAIIAPITGAIGGINFGALFGGGISAGGLSPDTGLITPSASIPGFAKGGRPDPSNVSIIGENGPELFIPDTSGRVIPNNKLNGTNGGGNGQVVKSDVIININAVDTQTGVAFLISQKDTIAGIFNQSLTSNGTIRSNF